MPCCELEQGTKGYQQTIPKYMNFLFAGTSGMLAISITHPADLLKTRMQLVIRSTSCGMGNVVGGIVKETGFRGFYKGLSAALLRQCIYTTGRLGIYNWLHDWYYETFDERPNYGTMIVMGMCGGAVGSFFGNPAEVALIRMTADGTLPPAKRRNYKNVFNAFGRIWKEEGLLSLWRGCSATIGRSAIINGTQLSTYTQVRQMLKPVIGDGPHLYVLAALISPIATILVAMPVDNIKTKKSGKQAWTKTITCKFSPNRKKSGGCVKEVNEKGYNKN